ncbi:MAG: YabP/YqfC family sporulation protein [Firmicutes bacterium]|nr:YabP/YqfC family sporulation protein [Bacillota bacterium]
MNIYDIAVKYEEFKKSWQKYSDIQITDDSEIVLDGCRKVIEYNENNIVLELPTVCVSVVGMDLNMRNFSIGGVVITGRLHSLTFLPKEEL